MLGYALKLVNDVIQSLQSAPGEKGEMIRNKLQSVLTKNEGYQWLTKVQAALGDNGDSAEVLEFYSIEEMLHLKFAQITSCEVERGFSYYKFLLGNRRRRFHVENLTMHLTIAVNQALRMFYS